MADRKKAKEQAIAESVEFSEMAKKPAPKVNLSPSERLKSFRLNPSQQDADAAPAHPSALKPKKLTGTQTHGPAAAHLIEAANAARANHLIATDATASKKAKVMAEATPIHKTRTVVNPSSLEGQDIAERKARAAGMAKERKQQQGAQAKKIKASKPVAERYPALAKQVKKK